MKEKKKVIQYMRMPKCEKERKQERKRLKGGIYRDVYMKERRKIETMYILR